MVIDKGQIVEAGTHEELLARRGRYFDLYLTQFAAYLDESDNGHKNGTVKEHDLMAAQ